MAITPIIPPAAGNVRTQDAQRSRAADAATQATSGRGEATQVDERTLAVAETVRQNQEAARSKLDEADVKVSDEANAQAALERQSTTAQRAQTNRLPPNILKLVNE
jgi:hypothetical protein